MSWRSKISRSTSFSISGAGLPRLAYRLWIGNPVVASLPPATVASSVADAVLGAEEGGQAESFPGARRSDD